MQLQQENGPAAADLSHLIRLLEQQLGVLSRIDLDVKKGAGRAQERVGMILGWRWLTGRRMRSERERERELLIALDMSKAMAEACRHLFWHLNPDYAPTNASAAATLEALRRVVETPFAHHYATSAKWNLVAAMEELEKRVVREAKAKRAESITPP